MATIIFETPRLSLRQFTEADAAMILLLNSRPEITKYVHEPVLKTEEEAAQILMNNILPQYKMNLGRWATYIKDTGEFIGWCGLKYRPEIDEIDLGYRFMQQYWGNGYATEAAQHTLKYGLQVLKLKVITGRAHVENSASLKVMEK
jgi:[ribosomal protein S5]-alanine N-acetyltransferase